MDNKRTFINMAIVAMLCVLWLQVGYPWLAQKMHWVVTPPQTAQTPAGAGGSSTTTSTQVLPTTETLATPHVVATTNPVVASSVTLGSTTYDPKGNLNSFPIGLALTSKGAGIESVTLNRFSELVDKPQPYVFQKPYDVPSPKAEALATRLVTIDGGAPIELDQLYWEVAGPADPKHSTATFQTSVAVGGAKPQIRIIKSYHLDTAQSPNNGYEIAVDYTIENLTAQPHAIQLAFNGPTSPQSENTRDMPEVVAGFDRGNETVIVEHSMAGSVKVDKPLDIPSLRKDATMLWSGMCSVYFDALVRSTDAAGKRIGMSDATASLLNPNETDTTKRAVAIAYQTDALTVPAGSSSHVVLHVYFGPKSREIISKNTYYSSYPLSYNQTLILTSGCYSICTWPILINLLVSMLQGFHWVLQDWGLAIIGLVLVVRLILHPITKSSQVSMSRMTKLGPEMERLKKKYGDDTEGLKQAQVEFYKEQGIAPFLGCLPMFLQTPIWIALWSALQSTFEIRHAPFLHFRRVHLTWINDLSQPDRLIALSHPIDILFLHIDGLNLLPILMGVVFYINQKFMPQPVALKPEQEQQQKMMKWMSVLLFPLMLYSSPSGLNLYIFTSTLIGIFEAKRVRAHIKEREEREQQALVIVDEPNDSKNRRGKGKSEPPKKPGGIVGLFMKLQAMADEAKQAQEKQKKNR
jgi:YidC/Oxa1 family membrane protein insertase